MKERTALDGLFRYADFMRFGEVHIRFDHATGLVAIIAIHSLKLGPAIGGCRLISYPSTDAALEDALRLAHMMSFKAAINHMPHGGAKAVLIRPKIITDRRAYFHAFGEFVHSLDGRYITAVDSGTSPADMDMIRERTPHVTCTTQSGIAQDPSPHTALGVCRGIEAAVHFHLGQESLNDVHVAIQGAGHVGYFLAKELSARGARLTMCDVNAEALARCVREFGVATVVPDAIYAVPADVFAPCALGAVLNLKTIESLQVKIVAGSANNQLAHRRFAKLLHERGILYAPDFVINAGGLIYVAALYDHDDAAIATELVGNIYHTLMTIFTKSQQENLATNDVAEAIAREKIFAIA